MEVLNWYYLTSWVLLHMDLLHFDQHITTVIKIDPHLKLCQVSILLWIWGNLARRTLKDLRIWSLGRLVSPTSLNSSSPSQTADCCPVCAPVHLFVCIHRVCHVTWSPERRGPSWTLTVGQPATWPVPSRCAASTHLVSKHGIHKYVFSGIEAATNNNALLGI